MRGVIRDEGFREGWSVMDRRGKVQVQYSYLEPDLVTRKKSTTVLPIAWQKGCTGEVLDALRKIRDSMQSSQKGLADAAELLTKRSAHQRIGLNWVQAAERFKQYKLQCGDISSDRRFELTHGKRLRKLFQHMAAKPPQTGTEIVELATLDFRGDILNPGAGRDTQVNTCFEFLDYCIEELGFDSRWEPPRKRAKYKGKKTAKLPSKHKQAGKKAPIREADIKPLMDGIGNAKWRLAIGMMVVYGLRGVELKYLKVRDGVLWTDYVKRNQRAETKPRPLVGIDPEGMPGLTQQLFLEFTTGVTSLPAMGNHDDQTSRMILQYLDRQPVWLRLKQAAADRGEAYATYSLRHRYAAAADRAKFTDREASALMGNSRATFVAHYGEFTRIEELLQRAAELQVS